MIIRVEYADGVGTIIGEVIRIKSRFIGGILSLDIENDSVGALSLEGINYFEVEND